MRMDKSSPAEFPKCSLNTFGVITIMTTGILTNPLRFSSPVGASVSRVAALQAHSGPCGRCGVLARVTDEGPEA